MMPTRGSPIADERPLQPLPAQTRRANAREAAHERVRPGEGQLQVVVGEADERSGLAGALLEDEDAELSADLGPTEPELLVRAEAPESRRPPPDRLGWHAGRRRASGFGPPA